MISIKDLVLVSLMTAIMCVLSPISVAIPVSPVPISLATFTIYLAVMILGMARGSISTLMYVLLGFVGLPVFSGFSGGVGKVLGPTGGYIIAYIFLAVISGIFIDKVDNRKNNYIVIFLGMFIGTIVLYIFGTLWLAYWTGMTFYQGLLAGVIPFIAGDLVKIIISIFLGSKIKKVLIKNNLL